MSKLLRKLENEWVREWTASELVALRDRIAISDVIRSKGVEDIVQSVLEQLEA